MDCTPDLRLGRWQTALAGVECDALICDPPYSAKTHSGQRVGGYDARYGAYDREAGGLCVRGLEYAHWTDEDVREFVAHWIARTRGWFCVFTSHDLVETYTDALQAEGRYVFAPLSCVQSGRSVRMTGDGPANWTDYLVVARPKSLSKWGALPGAYMGNQGGSGPMRRDSHIVPGAKPAWLMRAIVRDYSRPGDLVCDPCAGGGTTLLAAAIEGRRSIGSEMDADTYAKAAARLARGWTPVMRLPEVVGVQSGLDLAGGVA